MRKKKRSGFALCRWSQSVNQCMKRPICGRLHVAGIGQTKHVHIHDKPTN